MVECVYRALDTIPRHQRMLYRAAGLAARPTPVWPEAADLGPFGSRSLPRMSACEGSQSFLSVSRTDGKQLILRVCCHRDNPTFHHRPTVLGAVKDEALTGALVRVLDRARRRGKRPTDLRKKNIGTRGPALDTTNPIKERCAAGRPWCG